MKFISLNIKTAFIYAVLALLIITVVTTLIFENQSDLIVTNAVIESRNTVSGVIADIGRISIADIPDAKMRAGISALLERHSLKTFALYDGNGRLLSSSGESAAKTTADPRDFTNINRAIFNRDNNDRPFYADNSSTYDALARNTIDFYLPVRTAGGKDAVLKIPVSSNSISTRMNYLYRQVGLLIAGMLIIVLVTGFLFRKLVISPILEISRLSGIVGRADFSEKISYRSNDELGLLASRFNDMIDALDEKKGVIESTINALASQDRMVQQELTIANSIQIGMLPRRGEVSGIRLSAHYDPLHRISGDFYDTVEFLDGSVGVIIVDVSGHGIPAALITIMIKFLVSSYGAAYRSASDFLTRINTEMARVLRTGDYIAAFYLIIDPDNTVRFSSAGNCPAIVLERDGNSVYELADEGLYLGLVEEPPILYETKVGRLNPGDRIILFTDGVIEQRNSCGELYGEARLYSVIMDNFREPSPLLVERIIEDVKRFAGDAAQNDDMTLLIVDSHD